MVRIDDEARPDSTGAIQMAASALVQSMAAFAPNAAADTIYGHSEDSSRRDFWFAQGRAGSHSAPL